ncbi:transposase [Microbulbifer flavimaris]|uniref:Transposase n=1 Tax=Microbulbifer flavimaris TaxID=1781068 RepID=A0ABX4I029_9GAMM|nr:MULTISPECIES: transposase [Microbulbifer]KUJ83588.1 transposase [Microbulbifer sp. ZGT114]PCO05744.1 transposase [Microbulbifer flavimaris]
MPNFKRYNYNQDAMVVINFEEQLQPGTFEFTLHHLIDNHIDLCAFYDKYQNDAGGRSAYDPAILLKIILFAYSKGITSSREIQWQCEHNIIFKALSCDSVPHFTSIASFVSSYPDAIEAIFEQVLMVCDQQGLLGNELFAIDGCKMSSNASKEHSGTFRELEQKRTKIRKKIRHCLKEHKKLDGRKPAERERKQRLAQAAETLQKHFDKIDQFLKTAAPRMGQGKQPKEVKSNITDNESAKMTTSKGTIQGYNGVAAVDKKHQIIIEAQAFGEGQEHHTLKPILDGLSSHYRKAGIHDNILTEQVIVTADTGFSNDANNEYLKVAGINAYIPDNQFRSRDKAFAKQKDKYGKRHRDTLVGVKQVIPASEFKFDKRHKTCVCPAGKELLLYREERVRQGKRKLFFEGRLTDCRHCHLKHQCMRNPSSADTRDGHGRQVSATWTNGRTATDWMKKRVDSIEGKTIYSHRMSVVEPVFGNIGTNKRLSRFSLRGKEKVQGQWRLFCLIHNIEKLMRYGAIH